MALHYVGSSRSGLDRGFEPVLSRYSYVRRHGGCQWLLASRQGRPRARQSNNGTRVIDISTLQRRRGRTHRRRGPLAIAVLALAVLALPVGATAQTVDPTSQQYN